MMGIDAEIYVRVKKGEWPQFDDWYDMSNPLLCEIEIHRERHPEDATHELDISYRYWSADYRQGPCPSIVAALMCLVHDPAIERVWYGGDSVPAVIADAKFIVGLVADYLD